MEWEPRGAPLGHRAGGQHPWPGKAHGSRPRGQQFGLPSPGAMGQDVVNAFSRTPGPLDVDPHPLLRPEKENSCG